MPPEPRPCPRGNAGRRGGVGGGSSREILDGRAAGVLAGRGGRLVGRAGRQWSTVARGKYSLFRKPCRENPGSGVTPGWRVQPAVGILAPGDSRGPAGAVAGRGPVAVVTRAPPPETRHGLPKPPRVRGRPGTGRPTRPRRLRDRPGPRSRRGPAAGLPEPRPGRPLHPGEGVP